MRRRERMKTNRTEVVLKVIYYGGMIIFAGILVYASWTLVVGTGQQLGLFAVATFGLVAATFGILNLKLSKLEQTLAWLTEDDETK